MCTADKAEENFKKLSQLFPNSVTETINDLGEVVRAIDKDVLMQEISSEVIDGSQERYQFTWPDKKKSVVLSNSSIMKTLRLQIDKSIDSDGVKNGTNSKNIYIEGDNLDVLKLLQETYLGKVKMIYIDPPYNTGSDFLYNDVFEQKNSEYIENSGQKDEEGNNIFLNTETNGRFHTDWLNMMYPRIKTSKDLLSDDGVIFISIGQDEGYNLVKICNEIYGEQNHVGTISRMMKSGGNKGQYFSPNMEYILVYAKDISKLGFFREEISADIAKTYNHVETEGEKKGERYTIKGLCQPGLGIRPNQRYWIEAPDGSFLIPKGKNFPKKIADGEKILPSDEDTCWKWTYDRYIAEKNNGNICFQKSQSATALVNENGEIAHWNVFNKIWLNDRENEGRVPVDLITKWENRTSSDELKKLDIPFDFAKPVDLIKYLISLVDDDGTMTIMDFFSGSATTADAVLQLNSVDDGKRNFIMVQLPEKLDDKSEAFKAGYRTICDIGEERIKRAGKKIKEESPLTTQDLDVGFRCFKVDSSNMKDVFYRPSAYSQINMDELTDNIKEDRTPLDLLIQVMLDLDVQLSSKIEEIQISGKHVFSVADGYLIACFDSDINEEIVVEIAKKKPFYAVFRDSSMSTDSVSVNFEQIFETYSSNTVRKVL